MRRGIELSLVLCFIGLPALSAQTAQTEQTPNPLQLLEQGRVEEARNILLQMLQQDPNNQPANALMGQIAFDQKDYSAAVSSFQKAPQVLDQNPLAKVNYAEALLETKAAEAAARVLNGLPKDNASAQFEAGLLLARFEDFRRAEEHFKLAYTGYKEPQVVAYNLALAQFRLREYAACAATLEQIRARGFHDDDILNLQGQCSTESGQAEKALAALKAGIQQNPRDERNYLAVAKLAVDEDMASTGLELLDQGLHYLPDSYPLLVQRGYIHLSQGQNQEAEGDYRKAIALKPDSDGAQFGLAFVLLEDQHLPEAGDLLQRIIDRQPSNFFAFYLFGEVRIHESRTDDAIHYLERSEALQPNFAAVHTDLGKLYLRKSDAASAIRELEQSIRLDPDDTTAYYQISMAYRKAGDKEKSQAALAQVRVLNEEQRKVGSTKFITERFRKARNAALAPV
jgi:predicted Zn-dependent protease